MTPGDGQRCGDCGSGGGLGRAGQRGGNWVNCSIIKIKIKKNKIKTRLSELNFAMPLKKHNGLYWLNLLSLPPHGLKAQLSKAESINNKYTHRV